MKSKSAGWLTDIRQLGSGWQLIARILRRHRWEVASILVATLGVYASSLSVPIVIQNIVDGIITQHTATFIGALGIIAIALSIADVLLADFRRAMVISLGQRVDRHISLEIMAHVLGARIDAAGRNTGEILNMTEHTDKIKTFMIDISRRRSSTLAVRLSLRSSFSPIALIVV